MNKVILLAPTPPPHGGIAGWTQRMLQASFKDEWTAMVVDEKVIGGRQVFGDKTRRNIYYEIKRCLRIWKGLIESLKDIDVKVVHSCIPAGTLSMMREYVCAIITKINKRKFIIHYRCTVPVITKSKISVFILKRLSNKSDLVIALNKHTVDYLNGLISTPIVLIPNFVDANEICENKRINETIKTILYVGGVIPEKGCLEIIEVAKFFPDIEFRLVGNPDKRVTDAAKYLKNVLLVGEKNHDDVKKELNNADLFLFLSHFPEEGFSNALAEAMAMGLPCIVTDWAANADMIEDKGGIVVPINSIQSVVAAIKLCESSVVRKKYSEFNSRKVKSEYNSSVILDKYVDVYQKVCKTNINR